jgi:hypothetical protein
VQITFSDLGGQWQSDALFMTAITGPDGVAVFQLKQPILPRVDILDPAGYPCSQPRDFPTQEILDNGVVARWPDIGVQKLDQWCTPDVQAAPPQQKPGEVAFFVHPFSVLENFWYTLQR